MAKSADAFRTISEVADWLETPAHVLRFWESKFTQVKPVKRAGGRRYYRPSDMQLLGGIKKLLHEDGMTIKGVQKMLRDQGIRHVAALSQPLDELTEAEASGIVEDARPETEPESATIVSFQRDKPNTTEDPPPMDASTETQAPAEAAGDKAASTGRAAEETSDRDVEEQDHQGQDTAQGEAAPTDADDTKAPIDDDAADDTRATAAEIPSFLQRRSEPDRPARDDDINDTTPDAAGLQDEPAAESGAREDAPEPAPDPISAAPPAPALPALDLPDDPDDDVAAASGVLGLLAERRAPLTPAQAEALRMLAERLRSLGA